MIIYVVGPSRAGKSTLIGLIRDRFKKVSFVDLDYENNIAVEALRDTGTPDSGWEGRWSRDQATIQKIEEEGKDAVVDVGAGSLQTETARQYFTNHLNDLILVTASWDAMLARHPGRSPEEFKQTEFSSGHEELYGKILKRVDTTSSSTEVSSRELAKFLSERF